MTPEEREAWTAYYRTLTLAEREAEMARLDAEIAECDRLIRRGYLARVLLIAGAVMLVLGWALSIAVLVYGWIHQTHALGTAVALVLLVAGVDMVRQNQREEAGDA